MRLCLAILVAITNAAGPWLCCCAFAATIVRPMQANATAPVSKPTACPHCRTTNDDKSPAPIQKPADSHRNCMPGVTPVISTAPNVVDHLPIVSFDFWEATSIPQTVKPTVYVHVRLTPLLTSDERVCIHHVMNC